MLDEAHLPKSKTPVLSGPHMPWTSQESFWWEGLGQPWPALLNTQQKPRWTSLALLCSLLSPSERTLKSYQACLATVSHSGL